MQELLVLENDNPETLEKIIHDFKPSKSILASVINHNPAAEAVLKAHTIYHKLGHTSKIPFSTPVGPTD